MLFSVSTAARLTGKSVKTIYAAISSGRLSASSDSNGKKQIDQAELIRVYGALKTVSSESNDSPVDLTARYKADAEKYKRNAEVLLMSNKSMREQLTLLKHLLDQAEAREVLIREEHQQTMSIFQRLLPKTED